MKRFPLAVAIADIHATLKPPVARIDKDWKQSMRDYFEQLKSIAKGMPIICAGDVFDRWNAPAELINFLLLYMPDIYSVAGNHDCPNHQYKDLEKSAYWTLVQAGKIKNLIPNLPESLVTATPITLWGFPSGFEVKPCKNPHDLTLEVAVVHSMIWTAETGYIGAKEDQRLKAYKDRLKGYNVAIFGDNHKPFTSKFQEGSTTIHNCGAFFRRTTKEVDHKPSVGIIYNDGTVEREYLDVSGDEFDCSPKTKKLEDKNQDIEAFMDNLKHLSDTTISFREAVQRSLDETTQSVRNIVLNALEEGEK